MVLLLKGVDIRPTKRRAADCQRYRTTASVLALRSAFALCDLEENARRNFRFPDCWADATRAMDASCLSRLFLAAPKDCFRGVFQRGTICVRLSLTNRLATRPLVSAPDFQQGNVHRPQFALPRGGVKTPMSTMKRGQTAILHCTSEPSAGAEFEVAAHRSRDSSRSGLSPVG